MGKVEQNARLLFKSVTAPDKKTVRAVVTAKTLDRDGDIIDTASLRMPLKGGGFIYARELTGDEALDIPLFVDHERSVEKVIGSAAGAVINAAGELEVTFVFSSRALAQEMHTLLSEGHLDNAFSQTILYDPYGDVSEGVIYNGEVVEISLVFRGSNYNARLLEVSKFLQKGLDVSKLTPDKEAKRKKMEALLKEAEVIQKELGDEGDAPDDQPEVVADPPEPTPEPEQAPDPVPEPAPAPEPKPDPVEAPQPEVPEPPKPDEPKPEPETPEPIKPPEAAKPEDEPNKEDKTVDEKTKAIAAAAAAAKQSPVEVDGAITSVKANENAYKIIAVKQFYAFMNNDHAALRELNEKAMQLDTAPANVKEMKKQAMSKELSYVNGAPLYLAEQLDKDIDRQYADVGNVGKLVHRIPLTTSPKYRRIVRTDGVQFQPVGFKGKKQEDKPTWDSFTLEPKPFAVIVAWSDHVEEDAMINTYNEIVADIAEGRARLEDKLILTFETVTANTTVFPTQGLIPLLEAAAGRTVDYDYTADGFLAAVASAWGKIHSSARKNLSLVLNGSEWGQLALIRDTVGRPLFMADAQGKINLGGLGSFNVATSDELTVGEMVLGNYAKYDLAEKQGLQLKGSSDATVGELNLFEEDASALRAVVREEGGTARLNAFVKMALNQS